MTPNITPEALERAVELALAAIRSEEKHVLGEYKTPDNGARRRTITAAILTALPELLAAQSQATGKQSLQVAAQPASSAGGPSATYLAHPGGDGSICQAGGDRRLSADEILAVMNAAPVAGEAARVSAHRFIQECQGLQHTVWLDGDASETCAQAERDGLGRIERAYSAPPVPAAVPVDGEIVLFALNSGFGVTKNEPASYLTDAANAEMAWSVNRVASPFCDRTGARTWSGPTPFVAVERAVTALGMKMPAQPAAQGVDLGVLPHGIRLIEIPRRNSLDPINVFVQDYELGRGRIVVTCYGQAWCGFWGAMGGRAVMQFVAECEPDYVAGNMLSGRHEHVKKHERAYVERIATEVIAEFRDLIAQHQQKESGDV